MTGLGEDSHKHKSNDAARYLAESFFGLNMNPTDVGGEVLFDDYDDTKSAIEAGASSQNRPTDRAEPVEAFSTANSGNSSVDSAPNRFEENLDDLIVFSDDDDDDENDAVDDEDDDEEDDENFDFGEDEEDEDDDDDEEEGDDDDEEEEDEEELDDADLDFGDDVIVPAPKKAVTAARESRPARDERGVDSRTSSGRASAESRDEQRPAPKHRDEQRPAPKHRDEQRPAAKHRDEQRPAPKHRDEQRNDRRDERPASRGSRPQESRPGARADSRGSDRPPAAKAADAGRKSPSSDDEHWNELEGWVWDDESQRKPAAATRQMAAAADVDDDEVEEIVQDAPASRADNEKEDAAPRRRGRRRGGRGRGRHEVAESAAPTGDAAETTGRTVDFDIDFSEIMFDEDQEDFVSVSAGSVKAQRRIQDEPPSPAARESEPDDTDDEDEDGLDAERSAAGESGPGRPRRGRRGRRGRGRGREESGESVRPVERPAAAVRRPVRDEDNMDDDEDDDELAVEDVDLTDFGDPDDDEELPRRREGTRSEPARNEPARNERPPRSGQGRGYGHGQDDREPREPESTDRPRRQPTRDPRPTREPQTTPDSQPERRPRPAREPRPTAASDEGDTRRGPRPPIVAAEFQDIPTWEEAIGSLAIRTPSEEHARRTESRGRRDGGRPPRRRT